MKKRRKIELHLQRVRFLQFECVKDALHHSGRGLRVQGEEHYWTALHFKVCPTNPTSNITKCMPYSRIEADKDLNQYHSQLHTNQIRVGDSAQRLPCMTPNLPYMVPRTKKEPKDKEERQRLMCMHSNGSEKGEIQELAGSRGENIAMKEDRRGKKRHRR